MFRIDARDAIPIWKQIEDGVRRMVAGGALRPGTAVPSVRDLARELQVNPMTVSKAYQRLTADGVLDVRRGEGTFVSSGASRAPRSERTRVLRDGALRYVSLAVTLRASREETCREVETAWEQAARGRGGER